jgi:UDP-glucuronate decarboxylase
MNPIKNARVVVTGGAGFLGTNLCRKLLDRGEHVVAVDDLSSGDITNIEEFLDRPNFEFVEHDITESYDYGDVKSIYNLACPASPIQYQMDPIKTLKTNLIGVFNMLEVAKANSARILQASTSEIYGDPLVHPQVESYTGNVKTNGIRSCYDEGKRCAETAFFDYHRKFNLEIKVVRIFNTYGPKMRPDDGRVVSNFILQALRGDNISIYGDGTQSRSFCYSDDLIDGLLLMMASRREFVGPVNLGNPEEISIGQLAEMIAELVGSTSLNVIKPLPEDDPVSRRPDISLAKEELSWAPTTRLKAGLIKTIDYFRNRV